MAVGPAPSLPLLPYPIPATLTHLFGPCHPDEILLFVSPSSEATSSRSPPSLAGLSPAHPGPSYDQVDETKSSQELKYLISHSYPPFHTSDDPGEHPPKPRPDRPHACPPTSLQKTAREPALQGGCAPPGGHSGNLSCTLTPPVLRAHGQQDDGVDLLLPHQPPEVCQHLLERPLAGDVLSWVGVALRSGVEGRNTLTGESRSPDQTSSSRHDPVWP